MPETDNYRSIYPATGQMQAVCAEINGIWFTFFKYQGRAKCIYSHQNREDAFITHDTNIDILKNQTGVEHDREKSSTKENR
jgi:hypothetical protein